ncbi:MAG: AAA family ATPase [Phycisphaeraceae bacterium]|nr:AAA family ATPase [Phycisphaeraceae bacterium]
MTLCDAAMRYVRAGLAVLPASREQKRPALPRGAGWKPYQQRLPTEAEVAVWFGQVRGESGPDALCLVTGSVSGNLELIDFDGGGELFGAWAELVEAETPGLVRRLVVERSQSGGRHVVYHCGEPVCGSMKLAQRVMGEKILTLIETRGEGGLFLCHPTPGYELIQGRLDALPVLTAAEREVLLEAAWSLNEVTPPPLAVPPDENALPQGQRPGDAFNERGDPRKVLLRHGWTLARDGGPEGNQYWRRPGKTRGWSATLKVCGGVPVLYVFSSNAGPFAAGKAYGPFAVYTMLEHGGDYTRAAAGLRAEGYGASALPGQAASNLATEVSQEITRLEPMTVRQLVRTYPKLREPVIHGLLRAGETMNLISAPKMKKSWLVTDLALAVAAGREWLSAFQCERGDVLILDNELHGETSAHRIPKVAAARELPEDAYADRVWVQNLRGQLQDVFSLGDFFRGLSPGRFKVIILDAFYRFMPRDMDENDNGTMASLYNHIDRYADRLGCSFVLIHHTTKGNQSGKSVTDVGAGAGSQSRATDTHMVLRQHEEEDAVVLDAAVRSWPPVGPRCLRWAFPVWSPADDLDPERLKGEGGRKREEKKDEWTAQTFAQAFVPNHPTTRAAILTSAEHAGLSEYRARILLRQAEVDGLINRTGEPKRNQPCAYVRASVKAEEDER